MSYEEDTGHKIWCPAGFSDECVCEEPTCRWCDLPIENRATPSMGSPNPVRWAHVDTGASICGGIGGLSHRAEPDEEN